jgi:steroid 5-alpha reductase family enzyme
MIRTAFFLVVPFFSACIYPRLQATAFLETPWGLLSPLFLLWAGFTAYTISLKANKDPDFQNYRAKTPKFFPKFR